MASMVGRQRATCASPWVEVQLCDLPRCLRLRGREQAELQEELLVTPLVRVFSGTVLEEHRLPPLLFIGLAHDLLLRPWPVALRHEALLGFVVTPGAWLGLWRHHLDGLSLVILPPRRPAEDALTVSRKVVDAERQRLHLPLPVGQHDRGRRLLDLLEHQVLLLMDVTAAVWRHRLVVCAQPLC